MVFSSSSSFFNIFVELVARGCAARNQLHKNIMFFIVMGKTRSGMEKFLPSSGINEYWP
jgi:hypothetical protein